ncbi:hypothetical protein BDW72DRAFT_203711 [Aspergillus terricola var. indicus]
MTADATTGIKAMQGQWEDISVYRFEIREHMIMAFEGASCSISDANGQHQASFASKDALVLREVRPGDKCYVQRGRDCLLEVPAETSG